MWDRLRRRPLGLYFLYRSLAMTWAFMPFQVYFLEGRGMSLASIFDLNVVFSLATVVLEVPTGIYADRRGRRVAMALGGLVMTAACVLFVLGGGFWVYALANVLCALSMTLASGADSAFLYDFLAARRQSAQYTRLEGLSTAAKGIGNLLGVLAAGVIYAIAPAGVFVLTGALTACATLVALALPERRMPRREGSVTGDLQRALGVLRGDPRLLSVLGFGALTFVLFRIALFADQPHLEWHLSGAWAAHLALAAALFAGAKEIGGALVASLSGAISDRIGSRMLPPALALLLVSTYAAMGALRGVSCVALMVLLTSAFGLFSPLMRAMMNAMIEGPRDRATLLSFESMGRRLLFAAISPLFGRAVEASSLHAVFSGTAWAAALAYLALGVFAAAAFRRRPVPAPPVASALVSAQG